MKEARPRLRSCPVCETELNTDPRNASFFATPRGRQSWTRCPACRSFFSDEGYNRGSEVRHTRTRPWGMVESGIALNEEKGPMFEAVLRILVRHAPPGSSLLDIGCSYGGFLERARRAGYRVRGMDIVPEAVEFVRSRGIPCDRAASVGELDIPDNSLGVVSALDCNYYWPGQRMELQAIRSSLRPGGLLVMRTVDTSWAVRMGLWLSRAFPGAGIRLCEKAVYDHRVSIPVGTLLRLIRQEGFDIVYTSTRDAMPFRRNSLKVKIAYAVGGLAWRIARYNLAPGFVLLAGKRAS